MFRDVVEFAPDAFVFSDSSGLIVRVNRQAEQMFGYPRRELIGQPVEMLMPARLHRVHEIHRQTHLEREPSGSVMGSSLICMRRDGSEFPADINLSPLQTQLGSLVMSVVRDVTERQQANLALAKSRQHLRELYAQNEAGREVARKHLAREVHDELGQIMTMVRMDICLLETRFAALYPALTDKLRDMKALVDQAIVGVRHVVANLRPTALDVGLIPALQTLCTDFARQTALPCDFATRHEDLELDEARAVVVYRIIQESLTNIRRYAQASRVRVTLGCSGNMLCIEVQDDGCGFDPGATDQTKSFGLLGMHERAIALGGRVDIVSQPGQGTTVAVSIPLGAAQAGIPP
ncbi:MAG: PAS domain S-box protein [Rhodoferax sp.]